MADSRSNKSVMLHRTDSQHRGEGRWERLNASGAGCTSTSCGGHGSSSTHACTHAHISPMCYVYVHARGLQVEAEGGAECDHRPGIGVFRHLQRHACKTGPAYSQRSHHPECCQGAMGLGGYTSGNSGIEIAATRTVTLSRSAAEHEGRESPLGWECAKACEVLCGSSQGTPSKSGLLATQNDP